MTRLAETVTFRAPLGTATELDRVARREGKTVSEIAREALVARLRSAMPMTSEAA